MVKTLLHIRVPEDDAKELDRLAGQIFSRNDIAAVLLQAAIEAVRQDPDSLKFPPVLMIAGGSEVVERYTLNEPKHKARK